MSTPSFEPESLLVHDAFVRRLARRLVFDADLAEDVAQETMLAALSHPPSRPGSIRGWLAAVARSFALRALRGDARRSRREAEAARPSAAPSTEEILARESMRRQVVEAVLALEEPYRATMVLRWLEGLPPREVARRMDVPVETVRTRVKRAQAMLRERLDRNFGGRRAWCLALVREWELGPPSHGAVATAAAKSAVKGIWIMSTAHKLAAGILALGLLAASFLLWVASRGAGAGAGEVRSPVESAALEASREDEPTADLDSVRSDSSRAAAGVPPAPAPQIEPYGSLRVHLTWSDGGPAAAVRARVQALNEDDSGFRAVEMQSDDGGSFRLERVHAGRVWVHLDRGPTQNTVVEPAKENLFEIRIERGFSVEGTVVDAEDRPVPDAEIWLSAVAAFSSGFPVAEAGRDGRFRIESIENQCWIAARHRDHVPSLFHLVMGSSGTTDRVHLVLLGSGGRVTGSVRRPDGRPAVGALVLLAPAATDELLSLPDGTFGNQVKDIMSRVDPDGRFRFPHVPPGRATIRARAEDCAPWNGTVDVVESAPSEVSIQFSPGAAVEGTVSDETGARQPQSKIFVGDGWGLFSNSTTTRSDGAFRLAGIPPGEFTIQVTDATSGKASATFVASPGVVLRWDAVLSRGLEIRGRVVDDEDRPPGEGFVRARRSDRADESRQVDARLDAEGRFTLSGCAETSYALEVELRDNPGYFPDAVLEDVRPGSAEIVVRVSSASRASVRLVGVVVDPDGRPVESAKVLPWHPGHFTPILATEAGGRFDVGPFPPGTWQVCIEAPRYPVWVSELREISPGETWDLGTIRLEPGGSAVVALRREDGSAIDRRTWFQLKGGKALGQPHPETDKDELHIGPLPEGSYELRVLGDPGDRTATDVLPLEIHAGEETHAALVLHRGVAATVRLRDLVASSPDSLTVAVRILDPRGIRIAEGTLRKDEQRIFSWRMRLSAGAYRVEARASDGRETSGEWDVGAEGEATLALELRAP